MKQYYSIIELCVYNGGSPRVVSHFFYPVDRVGPALFQELERGNRELVMDYDLSHLRDDIWVLTEDYNDALTYEGENFEEDFKDRIYKYSGISNTVQINIRYTPYLNDIVIVKDFIISY